MPVLVIDVGNSSTAIASYRDGCVTNVRAVKGGILDTPDICLETVRQALATKAPPRHAALASVVPAANHPWRELLAERFGLKLLEVRPEMPLPFRLDYLHPESTGPDRLANLAGALGRFGAPALVVDIGTAVTYDLLSADLRFFTGVIGPGPEIMARALHDYTALLPLVEWWREDAPRVPKDSSGAMRFGIEAAFRGTLRETVQRLLPLLEDGARLIATGGFAGRFIPPLGLNFEIVPDLTLFGLGWLHDWHARQRLSPAS